MNKKLNLAILILSQISLLALLLYMDEIYYVVHDDNVMVDIASGAYGEVSQYIVNMHIALGWMLKGLFGLFPFVNWVSIFYLFIYLLSFIILDIVFYNKKPFGLIFLVLNASFILLVSHFTFTVVAYTAIIAGILLQMKAMKQKRLVNKYFVTSLILVLCGGLIRGEAIKSVLIIVCFYFLCDLKNWRKYFVIIPTYLVIMILCISSNLAWHKWDPTEKTFLEWGETRSSTLDCAAVPYDETLLKGQGISLAQYRFMYRAFYFDYEAISIQTLEKLAALNSIENKYNFNVMEYMKSFVRSVNRENAFMFGSIHLIILYFLLIVYFILCFKQRNRSWWKGLVIFSAALTMGLVFFVIRRYLYRVIMPNYILVNLLMLWLICQITVRKEINFWMKTARACLVAAAFVCVFCIRIYNDNITDKAEYSSERQYVLDYMAENHDTLYLAGDPGTFSVAKARPIFEYTAQNGFWTLMGDWEIYSVPYYKLMEKYNIENPDNLLEESIGSKNIRYLTTLGDSFKEYNDYIINYIQKKTGKRSYFKKEEDIVMDQSGKQWSVFSLKYERG